MPSRVIRDSLLTSKTLKAVPLEVELTFVHLLLVVDDYGRFDADPDVLTSALYPTRRSVTPETVMEHLRILASGPDPAIRFYRVDGRDFLALTGWETHRSKARRATHSKFPDPPEDCEGDPTPSPEIRGDPRTPEDPQPGSECRVASSESDGADGAEPAAHSPPEDRYRLVNLLARLEGEADEKRAWLDNELPVIEAEVADGNGTLRSLTTRYYRAYLKRGDREYRDWSKRQAQEAAKRRWDEDHLAEMQAIEAEEGRDAAYR